MSRIVQQKGDQVFGYRVPVESLIYDSIEPEEEYGEWATWTTHTISNKAFLVTDGVPDVVTPIKIEPDSTAWIVCVIWSEGDSFGIANSGQLGILGIFKEEAVAKELEGHIEATSWGYDLNHDGHSTSALDFTTSDGQHFEQQCVPWSGYFENLESVTVHSVEVVGSPH